MDIDDSCRGIVIRNVVDIYVCVYLLIRKMFNHFDDR